MPKYKHDATNYLIERAKPQGFDGVTNPSTTNIANRVSLPYDPQERTSPASANAIELLFSQTGESYSGSPELSTSEYGNIAKNDDALSADVLGLLRNFIQEETTDFEDQRVHDIVVDTSVTDRDIYVAWSCYDSAAPKYKVMLSKFGNDGTHLSTAEVASHETYNWAGKIVTGAYSQRPKKNISVAVEPLAGGAVCLGFIQETGVTHAPTFPSAGTGSGIMILRKKKTDLTDMAADPIVEIMPPSATDTMLELDVFYEVGSSIIHCALTRQTAGFVDSLWHGEYAVGFAGTPTVATSKVVLGSALDRLGQPTIVEDAISNVQVFYGEYQNSTNEMFIKAIDHATFGTITTWRNHALSYGNVVPFAVVPIYLAAGFAVVWAEDDGTSSDAVYKIKTGDATAAGGGTQTLYTRSGETGVGAINGAYRGAATDVAVFVTAQYETKERPIYIIAEGINVSVTPVSAYRWRQPTDAGLPVGEHFPMAFNDHANANKIFVGGSNYDGSSGEFYLGSSCFAALFCSIKGGDTWLNTLDRLMFVASAGAHSEFGDEAFADGCALAVYDLGDTDWVHGLSRRSQNRANSRFGEIGGSMHMEVLGSILQSGPPQEAVFAIHSNSAGELYDPITMKVGYAALYPDPEEASIVATNAVALAADPTAAIFHSTIERYQEDLEVTEWDNAVWSRAAARYAIPITGAAVSLLNGSDEIAVSVAPDLHGENITGLHGMACNPQTGKYYVVGTTNQTAGPPQVSFFGRVIPSTGEIVKIANLTDLYNDITFHSDGRCFAVVDSASANIGDIVEIDPDTGVEAAPLATGNAGSGQSLGFNKDDGLLYHLSQSPPIFESIHPDTGVQTPIVTGGAPVPAPTICGFMHYVGSDQFVFQTDLGGANNWYTIDITGVIAFVGSKGAGYYGIADEQTSLEMTDIVGTSENVQIAGCFFSPSRECMRLMRTELYLKRTGTVADLHKIQIVRVYLGDDGVEKPREDDVVYEADVELSSVDIAGGWYNIELGDGALVYPGAAYAIVLSRGERIASCYSVTEGASPRLQRITRNDGNNVDLLSLDLSNGFAETFTGMTAFAIDPTSSTRYVIGTTAESAEQFLGSIDPDGTVQFVGRLTGFTVDDMAFDVAGQAYVVMSGGSVTQPNGFAPINKGTGAIGADIVTCSAQTKHAVAWESGQIFYTINTDADVFEVIDVAGLSIAPIAQTDAPASLTPNALFFDDTVGALVVYGDDIRYKLDLSGGWVTLDERYSNLQQNIHGIDRDTDISVGIDDPANYISWAKANYYNASEESTHASYKKTLSGWSSNTNAMAMKLYAEVVGATVVEISRDDGVTWETVTHEVFGRRNLDSWNNVDLQEQQIYGSHVFENPATGSLLRIRYTVTGIYHNLKSISYFGK